MIPGDSAEGLTEDADWPPIDQVELLRNMYLDNIADRLEAAEQVCDAVERDLPHLARKRAREWRELKS